MIFKASGNTHLSYQLRVSLLPVADIPKMCLNPFCYQTHGYHFLIKKCVTILLSNLKMPQAKFDHLSLKSEFKESN